ncbi:beta-phosphoglucomutase family hydrolase [Streptomyces sp. NPDC006660]|uniref:HAD family hydrolase n=1 Tax=Streptomyces sp. NPDC006660 TaxID=3156901 RepID=UPI0033F54200
MNRVGLPPSVRACLFDLDGVLTRTATVHAAAWKETIDAFLRERDEAVLRPFDEVKDYDAYVDGLPRADGVRSFLASRGITLPEGGDGTPAGNTVHGLGERKNAILLRRIREEGVRAYSGSVRYLEAVRSAELRRAVVSSSANCLDVLVSAGIAHLVEVRIDAVVAFEQRLPGKPHPDTFLAAARILGVPPASCAVFEDSLAGIDAGRSGGFGFVIGVDRTGQAPALRRHGADLVVRDLAELLRASS